MPPSSLRNQLAAAGYIALAGCGGGSTNTTPPSATEFVPAETPPTQGDEDGNLVRRFQAITVVLDTTTGARFVEVGTRVERCSLAARQCFVRLRLLREPSFFHYVSAKVRSPDIASNEPLDAIREGQINRESPGAKPCGRALEACEIAVDLSRLLQVRRFSESQIVIVASRKELPEEKAARGAEEREQATKVRATCIADCVAKRRPKDTILARFAQQDCMLTCESTGVQITPRPSP